jgi:hypothetical protein
MQEKQKVTLYLPPELHRQLKIRAAVDSETMTEIAQKAIGFYLSHSEVVEQCEIAHGQAHQVYACPDCNSPVALQNGGMVSLRSQSSVILEDSLPSGQKASPASASAQISAQGEEELVPC